jgi:hypothetical protein
MILAKIAIWLVMYPFGLIGYIIMSIVEMVGFLFNSPVDIWNIISRAVDGVEEEVAAEE